MTRMSVCVFFLLSFLTLCSGKIWETTQLISRNSQWLFLDKFCFDNIGGTFSFSAIPSPDHPNVELLAYHDIETEEGGFKTFVQTGHSCDYKAEWAAGRWNLTETNSQANIPVVNARPRWWYLVLADCSTSENVETQDIVVDALELVFIHEGEQFTRHFSFDEFGMHEASLVFVPVTLLCLVFCTYCWWNYYNRDFNPDLPKYFFAVNTSMVLRAISGILILVNLTHYSQRGTHNPNTAHVATFCDLMSQVFTVAIFLFVSRGFTTGNVQAKQRVSITQFLLLYAIALVILWDWSLGQMEPYDVRYIYSTEAGTVIVVMRVIMLGAFLQNCWITMKMEAEPDKREFLKYYAWLGFFYLASLPVTVIVAALSEDWNRKKIVYTTEGIFTNLAYIGMIVFLRPGSKFAFQSFEQLNVEDQQADDDDGGLGHAVQMAALPQGSDDEKDDDEPAGARITKLSMTVHDIDEDFNEGEKSQTADQGAVKVSLDPDEQGEI